MFFYKRRKEDVDTHTHTNTGLDHSSFTEDLWFFSSVLSCPIARKHRLEEEEQDAEKPPSKRKAHPLRLALDEGFSAESDASSEADGEKDEDDTAGAAVSEESEGDEATPTQDGQTKPEAELDPPEEDKETYQMEEEAAAEGKAAARSGQELGRVKGHRHAGSDHSGVNGSSSPLGGAVVNGCRLVRRGLEAMPLTPVVSGPQRKSV